MLNEVNKFYTSRIINITAKYGFFIAVRMKHAGLMMEFFSPFKHLKDLFFTLFPGFGLSGSLQPPGNRIGIRPVQGIEKCVRFIILCKLPQKVLRHTHTATPWPSIRWPLPLQLLSIPEAAFFLPAPIVPHGQYFFLTMCSWPVAE
jgi:hypothetical protein